jgi:hypothetical protein
LLADLDANEAKKTLAEAQANLSKASTDLERAEAQVKLLQER